MAITPLRGFVLAKPLTRETKTKSGFDLPEEMVKDVGPEAEVLAVGEGYFTDFGQLRDAPNVKVGDKVLYRPFTGIKYGEFILLHFNDLVATL